jgi:nitroreductase
MSDDERELVGRLFELVDAPFHGALRALLAERAALAAELAALKAHDPLADYQEKVASIVYAAMRFDREDVTPEWQAGNSHAEYRARQAATEIAEMLRCARTAERDDARREVCYGYGSRERAMLAAERRGWDCFTAHATDGRVQNGGAA